MKPAKKTLIIVCIHHGYGFNEKNYPILRNLVESFKPDYWEYLNPGTIIGYFFHTIPNTSKADSLVEEVQEHVNSDAKFDGIGVGQSVGEMVCEITWRGRIGSTPLGIAADEAMKKAAENSKEQDRQTRPS
ncbi:MAG: hypothetical protein C0404_12435 [Verrucomicrobia bacterium]|nr:hypothetical protein [Verrucomicrobiota bacterium]